MNRYFLRRILFASNSLAVLLSAGVVKSEIVPDTTLQSNTVVSPEDCSICEITGGTEAGNNLFHSFEAFSVEGEAYFNNAASIENIIGRVTGTQRSDINGLIRANGTANLFLINPNGINFGANADLNIGGSFIASTANRLFFDDGRYFDASMPQPTEILSISTPVGLQFGQVSGSTSDSSSGEISIAGELEVEAGRTLALIGGEVNVLGGVLRAPEGSIEIISTGNNSLVQFTPEGQRWRFSDDDISVYGDINVSNAAFIDTSGEGAGAIQIKGQNIALADGSNVSVITKGAGSGGDLRVSASESLTLSGDFTAFEVWSEGTGDASNIFLEADRLMLEKGAYIDAPGVSGQASDISIRAVQVELSGVDSGGFPGGVFAEVYETYNNTLKGGNVTIDAEQLMIREGAQISVGTFGAASAGNLLVRASESFFVGPVPIDNANLVTGLFNQVGIGFDLDGNEVPAVGNAGEINVETRRLVIQGGGQIDSSTRGSGNAGIIEVNAADIELAGRTNNGQNPSGIFSQVDSQQATGDGGTIAIETRRLSVLNGAQVSTTARNEGRGGSLSVNASESITLNGVFSESDIEDDSSSGIFVSAEPGTTNDVGTLTITTDTLSVVDGAKISADNLGSGNGNTTTINARQFLIRDGGKVGAGSLIGPNVDASQLGSGGALVVNAGERLEVSGSRVLGDEVVNSELFTRAEGTGPAGNLVINQVPSGNLSVVVQDNAELSASTVSSVGGNIIFNNPNLVLLRAGGRITAEAGQFQGAGDGGNIVFSMPDGFIVAAPDEDSDIVANAFSGTGGNIDITAQDIIGFEERRATSGNSTNDIDASSEFGDSGTVTFNNPELDPTQGIVELPTNLSSPNQVAQRCIADSDSQNAFVVTGRGGASPSPRDIVRNETFGLVDLGNSASVANTATPVPITHTAEERSEEPIVEAEGWQRSQDGTITLIAQSPPAHTNNSTAYLSCSRQARR